MISDFKRAELTEAAKTSGRAAQLLFESLFSYTPKIDNRTPEAVAAGLSVVEFNELRS